LVSTTFMAIVSEEVNSSENWIQLPCSTYMTQEQCLFAPFIVHRGHTVA
jgi:hypothetical protein